MRVFEGVDRMLEVIAATQSPATVRTYGMALSKFLTYLDERSSDDVTTLRLEDFIHFAEYVAVEQGLQPRSRAVVAAAVKRFMDLLIINDLFIASQGDLLKYKAAVKQYAGKALPKKVPANLQDAVLWTRDAAIQSSAKDPSNVLAARDAAVISFLWATGCRVSEAVGLDLIDFDLDAKTAEVQGKGGKVRTLFYDGAKEHLLRYWRIRGATYAFEYAFAGRVNGTRMSGASVRVAINDARNMVAYGSKHEGLYGVHLTPHLFRHAFASRMLERTGNLAAVQDMMGHSSPTTTRIYAKLSIPALRKVFDEASEGV